MKILLINDDGVDAPGLWAAARALRQVGDVFVVAPDRQQSGVGASLTLHAPLRVRELPPQEKLAGDADAPNSVSVYAVEGTPGDSCILALESIVGAVDLVVSGINPGSNLGWDVMVSGTVGGAVQGYMRGFPTIAISVGAVRDPNLEVAAQFLQYLGQRLRDDPPATCYFLNINVPNLALDQISGVQVTRLGDRSYGESVRQESVGQDKRYWIARKPADSRRPFPGYRHLGAEEQPDIGDAAPSRHEQFIRGDGRDRVTLGRYPRPATGPQRLSHNCRNFPRLTPPCLCFRRREKPKPCGRIG